LVLCFFCRLTELIEKIIIFQARDEVQNKWSCDQLPVVVATVAFGMGVDKATVRFFFQKNFKGLGFISDL